MPASIVPTRHFITGGAGFIGSRLAGRLLNAGEGVTVFDNLSAGSKANLQAYRDHPQFTFIEEDLLNREALDSALTGHSVVWHLAANSDVQKGNQCRDLDLKNGLITTYNVLEAMRLNHIPEIMFSSSSVVYGEIQADLLSESAGPLLPISAYGAAKLSSEGWISAYSHLYNIRSVIFRFANVIGAGIRRGVVYDFIAKLKKNRHELEILGDGRQSKCYLLVDDCLDAMLVARNKAADHCVVFNVGCDSVTSVNRIAAIVIEEMGLRDVSLKYTGTARGWPGDVTNFRYDVSKLKNLGWSARYSSDEAVRIAASTILAAERQPDSSELQESKKVPNRPN